ncbi:cytochrome P450 90D2 [Selaginella moellendorffii]|uniref:cytochrome P450 90D2 n=1 Tax=Selaginella moellendorffii TaxID=88036 RepID=UPI000D1C9B08|nr:cytochrome P450 90D2 [Selaginella moellendorffii]|eukprot:XP_024538364.1 cytochrome P450 90D2 [Selaginella moellendorffii]
MISSSTVWAWTSLAGVAGVFWLAALVYWRSWRFRKLQRLPPGSMGWPLIGELVPYVTIVRSETPFRFTRERESKYGPVFKTSLLTGKTVMITDVEGVKFVLHNEGVLFETGYPRSLKDVPGEHAMLFHHGDLQKRMHAMLKRFVSSTPLKKHLTREMELLTKQGMRTWSRGQRILLQDEIQRITHDFLMKQLFGLEPGKLSTTILKEFHTLMAGIIGIPMMIPGTPYFKSMKAREKLSKIIMDMVATRRAKPDIEHKDILNALIEEIDNVLVNIANAENVPAVVIALAVKNLSETPKALEHIREENLAIRKGKDPSEGLSWNDYMSLEFTQAVFNETLRLANGAQGVMRKALKDVEYRGYIIPKGWTVLPYFLNIHFDENMFPNSAKFHPWRWLEKNIPPSYVLPFGGGSRLCPGQELAKVQTAVFLHHLVTQFKWDAEPEKVINFPMISTRNHVPVVLYDLN